MKDSVSATGSGGSSGGVWTGGGGAGYNPALTPRDAAERFMKECGLSPTADAISQLTEAFLPALRIMTERGYDPEGATWRESGWRGVLTDIRKKFARLWFRSWKRGNFDGDSAIDLINFCGFYFRQECRGTPWGEWGEPEEGDI